MLAGTALSNDSPVGPANSALFLPPSTDSDYIERAKNKQEKRRQQTEEENEKSTCNIQIRNYTQ